jgi:hypothetical protein
VARTAQSSTYRILFAPLIPIPLERTPFPATVRRPAASGLELSRLVGDKRGAMAITFELLDLIDNLRKIAYR